MSPSVHLNDSRALIYDWFKSWVDIVPTRKFSALNIHPLVNEALNSNSLSNCFERFINAGERLSIGMWEKAHHCFESSLLPFEHFATTPLSTQIKAWIVANYDGPESDHSTTSLSQLLAIMTDLSLHNPLHEQHHLLHNYLLPLSQHSRLALPLCAGPYRQLSELLYRWCLIEDQWLTQHAH
ncbi:hypothetical protein [Umboniibacter marinipuniceus]|uniref:Uncharacterized protein n=1 Tax=Umboniibacter marinipuniceus TaxID=569599 RepID=A0A3M0AC52_9GAMM|nr:hypothetical protein [Umboniibacter marinipuniceus]RMA82753.1 hypothetical protein DFR27_0714 [Umboniibacter marinipuniceus]